MDVLACMQAVDLLVGLHPVPQPSHFLLQLPTDFCMMQVSQIPDQEVSEEAQCAGLATSDCLEQGSQVSDI